MKRAWQPDETLRRCMSEKVDGRRPSEVERESKTVLRMVWLVRT